MKLLNKLYPTAKRVVPLLTVVLLVLQIPNQGVVFMQNLPVLRTLIGAS